MGTRHSQRVIDKQGALRISQYGQWDGYPSGQGKSILNYLLNGNLEKYQQELEKINPITEQQAEEANKSENVKNEFPYMFRECGSKIHQMIEDGKVLFVSLLSDEEAEKWCEGFYTIDFQKGIFISEFYDSIKEYPLDNLPTEEQYLFDMASKDED